MGNCFKMNDPNPNPNAFAPAQYSPYGPVPSPYNQPPPGY